MLVWARLAQVSSCGRGVPSAFDRHFRPIHRLMPRVRSYRTLRHFGQFIASCQVGDFILHFQFSASCQVGDFILHFQCRVSAGNPCIPGISLFRRLFSSFSNSENLQILRRTSSNSACESIYNQNIRRIEVLRKCNVPSTRNRNDYS